jgi:hypothetical protein
MKDFAFETCTAVKIALPSLNKDMSIRIVQTLAFHHRLLLLIRTLNIVTLSTISILII